MRKTSFFLLFSILVVCSGCWRPWSHPVSRVASPVDSGVSVEIIRDDVWQTGGSLAFIPFSPGDKAEAGPELDRIAFSIVKGFAEGLSDERSHFSFLTDNDAAGARYVFGGRVEEFSTGSSWMTLGMGKRRAFIKIKGEVRDHETGEVIAVVFVAKDFDNVKEADRVAYAIGRALAGKMGY